MEENKDYPLVICVIYCLVYPQMEVAFLDEDVYLLSVAIKWCRWVEENLFRRLGGSEGRHSGKTDGMSSYVAYVIL